MPATIKKEIIMSRSLAVSASYIENPVLCVTAGEAVSFLVNTNTKSYPVYFKESLLNSNLDFDYGQFLQLQTAVE